MFKVGTASGVISNSKLFKLLGGKPVLEENQTQIKLGDGEYQTGKVDIDKEKLVEILDDELNVSWNDVNDKPTGICARYLGLATSSKNSDGTYIDIVLKGSSGNPDATSTYSYTVLGDGYSILDVIFNEDSPVPTNGVFYIRLNGSTKGAVYLSKSYNGSSKVFPDDFKFKANSVYSFYWREGNFYLNNIFDLDTVGAEDNSFSGSWDDLINKPNVLSAVYFGVGKSRQENPYTYVDVTLQGSSGNPDINNNFSNTVDGNGYSILNIVFEEETHTTFNGYFFLKIGTYTGQVFLKRDYGSKAGGNSNISFPENFTFKPNKIYTFYYRSGYHYLLDTFSPDDVNTPSFSGSYKDLTDKPREDSKEITILSNEWSGSSKDWSCAINFDGLTTDDDVYIYDGTGITAEEYEAIGAAKLARGTQSNGSFSLRSFSEEKPKDLKLLVVMKTK